MTVFLPPALRRFFRGTVGISVGIALARCGAAPDPPAGVPSQPVYNRDTGRLEQLKADINGDGKTDTVAYMDGTVLKYIEIDKDGDGKPDRWEYYGPGVTGRSRSPFDRWAVIERAEEGSGTGGARTRREFYVSGTLSRVEEDTDRDGRTDKWEFYENGLLTRVEMDLQGKGFADRRLTYGPHGDVERIDRDPDGDGTFEPMPQSNK